MKLKLALIGSREFNDFEKFEEKVLHSLKNWEIGLFDVYAIVSGGARGADTLARRFAKKHHLELIELKPNWKLHGRAAGVIRNSDIINACDRVVAFPSHSGSGTQDSVRKALKMDKECEVYFIEDI